MIQTTRRTECSECEFEYGLGAPRSPQCDLPCARAMTRELTQRDRDRLVGVDEKLVRVVEEIVRRYPVVVLEGVRTKERQFELVKAGKSKTLLSKHLEGRAVDLGVVGETGTVVWEKQLYDELGKVAKQVAAELGVPLRWGGDFKSFYDGPHIELMP